VRVIRGLVRRFLGQAEPRKVVGREEFTGVERITFYPCVYVPGEAYAEVRYVDGRTEYVEVQGISTHTGAPDYPPVMSNSIDRTVVFYNPDPTRCRMTAWTEPVARDIVELRVHLDCGRRGR
jgi:hypothetical protein